MRSTPGSASATRWPAAARSTGRSCTCTLRTRTSRPAGSARERVALADRAGPERAGHDGPDPAKREDAVDEEPRRPPSRAVARRGRPPSASAALSSSRPSPVTALVATTAARRDELARLGQRQLAGLLVDCVDLRDGDDAVLDPEQLEDREVLLGLRSRALARVHDEEEEVDPRSRRRPWCARSARGRARRRGTGGAPRAARAGRSRGRWRCRARCSSGSRSVSLPVSAATSRVFPWSTWPAVPTVSGTGRRPPRPPRPRRRRACGSRAGGCRRARRRPRPAPRGAAALRAPAGASRPSSGSR